jgi:flagellar biosynthesis protein FlhB
MRGQVMKLAAICNVCFWLTIIFKYWKNARYIQQDVLNTILILGMVALFVNMVWFFLLLRKKSTRFSKQSNPVNESKNRFSALGIFNIISSVAELIHIILFYMK